LYETLCIRVILTIHMELLPIIAPVVVGVVKEVVREVMEKEEEAEGFLPPVSGATPRLIPPPLRDLMDSSNSSSTVASPTLFYKRAKERPATPDSADPSPNHPRRRPSLDPLLKRTGPVQSPQVAPLNQSLTSPDLTDNNSSMPNSRRVSPGAGSTHSQVSSHSWHSTPPLSRLSFSMLKGLIHGMGSR